jgi:hypothetical protein
MPGNLHGIKMKNPLEKFISENSLNEVQMMNHLQAAGIVSDNCILADSVAIPDRANAILHLKKHVR